MARFLHATRQYPNFHPCRPKSLNQLDDLAHLDLRRNKLSGPVPASILDMPSPATIYLEGNALNGGVHEELPEYQTINDSEISVVSRNF